MYKLMTSLFNVRPQETWLVKKLFFIQFFLVLAGAFLYISANTIFIYTLPITDLPKAYMISAAFLFVANYFYHKMDTSFDVKVLSYTILGICASLVLLQWLWMQATSNNIIPYVLLVVYNVSYVLMGYLFWTLAALLFNTRDSKRIFTIISGGDLPAKMTAYLVVGLVATVTGLTHLLLLSLGSLAVAFYLVRRLFQNKQLDILEFEHEQVHYFRKQTLSAEVNRVLRIFGSELILALSVVAFLSFFVFVFIDFTFLTEVKPRYKSEKELASFFGIFFALGRAGGLLIKLVFSSRMINRLGIVRTLLFLPITLIILCFSIFIADDMGFDPVSHLYIFGSMFLLAEIGRALVQEPVFFVLFQPLKLDLRLKGHVIAKGYMYPLALLVAGFTLVNYLESHRSVSLQITTAVLVVTILVWIAMVFTVKKSYVKTLQDAIRTGFFRGNELYLDGEEATRTILLQQTESRKPAEVIYALNLLERANYNEMSRVIQRMLGRKESVIVDYALDWIKQNKRADMIQGLEMLADSHPDEEIRAKCLYTMGIIAPERLEKMKDLIYAQHPSICIAAVTALLHSKNALLYKEALDRLYQLAIGNTKEKKMAAEIIGKGKRPELGTLLIQLLNDHDPGVQQAAILSAGDLSTQDMVEHLVQKMRSRGTVQQARLALIRMKEVTIEGFISMPLPTNDPVIPELIRISSAIVHERSQFYLQQIATQHPVYRMETIHALWQLEYTADSETHSFFNQVLNGLLRECAALQAQLSIAGTDPDSIHLRRALYYELRSCTDTVLRLLSFLSSREKINQVIMALELKESFKTSNSLELLQVTLPSGLYKEIERLLDVVEMNYTLYDRKNRYKNIIDVLEMIIMHAPLRYNRWTNAQAIYETGRKKVKHIITALKKEPVNEKEPIIIETKQYVIQNN